MREIEKNKIINYGEFLAISLNVRKRNLRYSLNMKDYQRERFQAIREGLRKKRLF